MADRDGEEPTTFRQFGLDARLLRGIANCGFGKPTLIQEQAIPLALQGKDLLVRARTGSGKTAAYLVPVLANLLSQAKAAGATATHSGVKCLILVPSRELAQQVQKTLTKLLAYCAKSVSMANIATNAADSVHKSLLLQMPDIVISTPAKAVHFAQSDALRLGQGLSHLVIDEADLVLSYGYESDVQIIARLLPRGVQTFLMSATLTKEVAALKGLVCRQPVTLKLQDESRDSLTQYVVTCGEKDKFLLAYVLLKLNLIRGKKLIFVNTIDRCFRLKLFLEQFGVKSVVLNSELPVNSRLHILEELNKGVYGIAIATDEGEEEEEEEVGDDETVQKEGDSGDGKTGLNKKRKRAQENEYGVVRGVDFQNISCVLNFDMPTSVKAYVHRIGRTARAGQSGVAMTFCVPRAEWGKEKSFVLESARRDERVMRRIDRDNAKHGRGPLQPYQFDMRQVDAFRYRMEDAARAVTGIAVREARQRELRQEIMASDKLKTYFEENPQELDSLRHDAELHAVRRSAHMKNVPDYLLPQASQQVAKPIGHVPYHRASENRIKRAHRMKRARKSTAAHGDPLKRMK